MKGFGSERNRFGDDRKRFGDMGIGLY